MISLEEVLHMKEPYELFTPDEITMREQRKMLIKRFHPDANGGGAEYEAAVFVINSIYDKAVEQLKAGIWESPGKLLITGKDGIKHEMYFKRHYAMDLGKMYIGNSSILYLFDKENQEFSSNFLESLKHLRYADHSMEEEFKRYLPQIIARFEAKDGRCGLVVRKEPELISLREIIKYFNGRMDPRSVAWILSSLYNLLCFFEYNGINHNDITVDNYFISPQNHYGAMLGGWWYSKREGEELEAVSECIYKLMTKDQLDSLKSSRYLDMEAVHHIGRILLGDETGNTFNGDRAIPKPLADWVRGPVYTTVFEEYDRYSQVLYESFGRRCFYPMEIDQNKLERIVGGN